MLFCGGSLPWVLRIRLFSPFHASYIARECPSTTEIPSLWDLMSKIWCLRSDDLRWGWYHNNSHKVPNKCNVLVSSPYLTALVPGKTVFHETGPWCQKCWGLLLYQNFSYPPESSNMVLHQIHLEGLLNQRLLDPTLRFWFNRLGWGLKNLLSNQLSVMLMLSRSHSLRTLLLWWSSVQFLILWLNGEILDSESEVDFSEVNFPKVNSLKIISPTPYRLVLGMFVLPLSDLALALEKIWLCSRKSPRLCICHTACGWPKGGGTV